MANAGTVKTSVLCDISGWKTRKTNSHLAKTDDIKYRYLVCSLSNGWALTIEQDSSPAPINKKFAARFADLACCFKSEANVDPEIALAKVIESLEEKTGKKFTLVKKPLPLPEKWIDIGRQIDVFFDVDYNSGSQGSVRERLFGVGSDDE